MTEELRYLSMKKEAWEEIIKPAIEKHFHIEGLSGKYEELPIAPPKDWRPQCYYGSRLCSPDKDYRRSETCEKCPFRLME